MKIERGNKTNLQTLSAIPEINKIGADDYNEIKTVVNANDDLRIALGEDLNTLDGRVEAAEGDVSTALARFHPVAGARVDAGGTIMSSFGPITVTGTGQGNQQSEIAVDGLDVGDMFLQVSLEETGGDITWGISSGVMKVTTATGGIIDNKRFSVLVYEK